MRAELLVAYLILADRRFELSFEAYGARRLGPDLTVTFRANQRFNLEVTRLRTTGDAGDDKLANVIAGKLRQLPGEIPNALVIAARGLDLTEESLVAAVRLLKTHTDQKDDTFFARRGFKDARDFYAQYFHLGGIFVLDEATDPARAIFSPNREARQPLVKEALSPLMHCLTASHGTAPKSPAPSRAQTRASVAASATPSKSRSRTFLNTASSGAACWNKVIDERSFCASIPPKICSAVRPSVSATIRAASISRGPSTGCCR